MKTTINTQSKRENAFQFATALFITFFGVMLSVSVQAKKNGSPTMFNKLDTRLYYQSGVAGSVLDANMAVFDNEFSNGLDPYDAFKMSNSGENLAIRRSNTLLVIEARKNIIERDTLYFEMWNMQSINYSFEFEPSFSNTLGLIAILQDRYTGINTIINMNAISRFNFTCDANAGSKARDRFKIVFSQANALPVNFLNVSANTVAAGVEVIWKVASEYNVARYELERSYDGKNFSFVQLIAPLGTRGGTQTYSYTDATTVKGDVFYRVKNVDLSGDIKYSTIVKINLSKTTGGVSVYPNPISNGIMNVQLNGLKAGNYEAFLFNTSGQPVFRTIISMNVTGFSTQTINISKTITPGNYQLVIKGNGEETQSTRVIIL